MPVSDGGSTTWSGTSTRPPSRSLYQCRRHRLRASGPSRSASPTRSGDDAPRLGQLGERRQDDALLAEARRRCWPAHASSTTRSARPNWSSKAAVIGSRSAAVEVIVRSFCQAAQRGPFPKGHLRNRYAGRAMAELTDAKRRLIERLKRSESATASELAGEFGLTDTAVRQHLEALESIGLVARAAGFRRRPWASAGELAADADGRRAVPRPPRRPDRRADPVDPPVARRGRARRRDPHPPRASAGARTASRSTPSRRRRRPGPPPGRHPHGRGLRRRGDRPTATRSC